jgi:membrane protease YdiL (CAAX protease family)
MSGRTLARFCGTLLAATWLLEAIALYIFHSIEAPGIKLWLLVVMFLPSVWTAAFLISHPAFRKTVMWKIGNPWFWPLGVLLQIASTFAVVFAVLGFGWGYSGWFHFSSSEVTINGGPWLLGIGRQSWLLFIANVLVTGIAYSALNGIVTVGEEFCWRGFLQNQLIKRFGMTKGVTVLGLFWAAWHLPIILAGYNYPEHPVLGAFVIFPLLLVSTSFLLAWLTLRSRSLWPAVLTHGAANSIATGVVSNLQLTVPLLRVDLITLVLAAGVGVFCWLLLARSPNTPIVSLASDTQI